MMGHPRFELIRALAAGALAGDERACVARHLERCARCRAAMASIPALVRRVEQATDLPVPDGAWERILARRAAGERVIVPAMPTGAIAVARPARTLPLRRAAVVGLALGGIASAALAVPLVTDWLRPGAEAGEARRPASPAPAAPAPEAKAAAEEVPVAGVSVTPSGASATVDVDGAGPELRIRVRVVDGGELEARAASGAAGAVFHPRPTGLRVENAGAGELELLLPRAVHRVMVRVDGRPYLLKEGEQLRVLAPAADTAGSEVLLRVRAPG
ncbi:MAG TPA: hypothetical protein VFQ45_05665 [Longimicrobium sp.]|nr:hypothetical protein [Longimicrobium sp.]